MRNRQSNMSRLLVKGILTSVLIFSVGAGSVFADSASPSPTLAVSTASTASTLSAEGQTDLSTNTELQKPGLLPGDFFYFIKSAYEDILTAITVGDVKEAKLLAEFAQERLAEAQALWADGKTELAEQTLQKALKEQQASLTKLYNATGSTTAQATPSASPATATATPAITTAIPTPNPSAATVSPSSSPTVSTEDDDEDDKEVEDVKNPEQILKVKADLQHNIVALTAALEKVKNPKAQKALLKNIVKSFAHLEKKLSKIEGEVQIAAEQPAPTAPTAAATTTPAPTVTETQTATPTLTITATANIEDNDDAGEVEEKKHNNKHKGQKPDHDKQKEKHENNGNGKGHNK